MADVTCNDSGSTAVMTANSYRQLLILQCPSGSAELVRLTFDGTTPGASNGVELAVGGGLVLAGTECPKGAILGWSAGGTGTVAAVQESRPTNRGP